MGAPCDILIGARPGSHLLKFAYRALGLVEPFPAPNEIFPLSLLFVRRGQQRFTAPPALLAERLEVGEEGGLQLSR